MRPESTMHTLIGRHLVIAAALVAATASGGAWADGPRTSVGIQVAAPGVAVEYRSGSRVHAVPRHPRVRPYHYAPRLRYVPPAVWVAPAPYWGPTIHYGPSWYGGYYYYGPGYSGVDPQPTEPQVWIERGQDESAQDDGGAAAAQGWWYWCDDPQGYHPQVRECPGGWRPVAPQPAERR